MASLLVAAGKGRRRRCGWPGHVYSFSFNIFAPKTFDAAILTTMRGIRKPVTFTSDGISFGRFIFSEHSAEREETTKSVFAAAVNLELTQWGAACKSMDWAIICSRFVPQAAGRHTKTMQLPFPLCLAQRKQAK